MSAPRPLARTDYEREVLQHVETHGWHCTSVSGGESGQTPPFAYSVGLHAGHGAPEFIVFGLDGAVAHSILSTCADAYLSGDGFDLDAPCHDLVNGYPCRFVRVPPARAEEHAYTALWFHGGAGFPLYQVAWPDVDGRFPWEAGVRASFRALQPVLGEAPTG